MTAADSLYTTFGGLTLPAEADEDTGTLASLDPARDQLLEFFKTVINSEFTEAWADVTDNPLGTSLTPVADTLPAEPTQQVMTERKCGFPLLALHRDGTGVFEDYTLERDKLTQPWKLHYILGPLDVLGQRKLGDLCQAVAKTIRKVIRQRRHMSYQDGALQFFGNTSALAGIELNSYECGNAAFAASGEGTTIYYAAEMTLTTLELSDYVEGSEESDLTGLDLVVGVGDEEEILPDTILAST